jgi:hypothetical protein
MDNGRPKAATTDCEVAVCRRVGIVVVLLAIARAVAAQDHDHAKMLREMAAEKGWVLMQDGVVWTMFNHQSGERGGSEFVAPNWWMLMGMRKTPKGLFSVESMFSLDPATVGGDGYGELFQAGEAYRGNSIVDRQHPHDLFMRLAVSWRVPLSTSSTSTVFTLRGGVVDSPALGPIPFMHRASAFDNPMAPLTHHLFDSTHVSFGVVTASFGAGAWTLEGSVFNGREPDEHRWDFDFGRMDSVSGRLWFTPTPRWAFQVSTGHLVSPEQLEPGDIERTTTSLSWTRASGDDVASITAGYGRNDRAGDARQAGFVEAARHWSANTIYARIERTFLDHAIADVAVTAFTVGGVRDMLRGRGLEGGVGAGVTLYATPSLLDHSYGPRPLSFQVFFRLRRSEHMVNMR